MSKPGEKVFPVPGTMAREALVDREGYERMYRESVEDPEAFWGPHGKRIDWIRPYSKVKDSSYGPGDVRIRWFHDGTLNVAANCVDRHAEATPDRTAIIWEGDDPAEDGKFTYAELRDEVCRMANVLRSLGVKKGDRVTIYMPMIPEVAFALTPRGRSIGQYVWIPSAVVPYVGAGGGLVRYGTLMNGRFVDVVDYTIFSDAIQSQGWTPSVHAFGGVDFRLTRHVLLTTEARYAWATAKLDGVLAGFDHDLAGLRISAGVRFVF